ncbi:MAG: hypothetical protein N3G76_01285 [Candidatus Micrarchaeota archaeon]|nr:hypothetical protein [Candidatus Micrarchaeota archaeon]
MSSDKKGTDIVIEPMGASFRFGARRKVQKEQLLKIAEGIPDSEIADVKDSIAIIKIDSRDIDGVPYLFSILYLHPDSIEMMYTVTPETSMRKRQLELLRYTTNILVLLKDAYEVDLASYMQVLDVFLAEIREFATSDYEKLYTKYDALLTKIEELEQQNARLRESNEKLSKDMLELRDERNELKLRVDELEKFSDDALMLKIQDWIREHAGEINIGDFCKIYKVGESRVEQVLNKMVREGYLETVR